MNVNSMNKWVGYPDFKLYMYMYLYNTLEKSGYQTHYHKQVIWGIVITKENTNGREIESRLCVLGIPKNRLPACWICIRLLLTDLKKIT